MGNLIPPPGMTEEEIAELAQGHVLVPIDGRPDHYWNTETGRPVVARAGATEAEILAELAQPENLPPPEPPRDVAAELDALKTVLIEEDPAREVKIQEQEALQAAPAETPPES